MRTGWLAPRATSCWRIDARGIWRGVRFERNQPAVPASVGPLRRAVARFAAQSGAPASGSPSTAGALVLSSLGVAHRRGGYRDPESQAFIESWFSKLKERCV